MRTTVGQLLVNRTLPKDLRDYRRELDKKAITKLLREVAEKYPERYKEISHNLAKIGHQAAYTTGGNSFGLRHLRKATIARKIEEEIRGKLAKILTDDSLTPEQRNKRLIAAVGKYSDRMKQEVYRESLEEDNPLARQVLSGSRGNPMNLASLRGADLLYVDHRNRVLPIPVLRSYSQGLTPLEYWAGTYGARKGVVDVKMATQRAGFLSKQLAQIAHRAVVTAIDADKPSDVPRGLPVETADEDNEGALLAQDAGGYSRNTVLTPKILSDLQRKGIKRILVRSPTVGGAPDGGLYARDVGVREHSRIPEVGESVVGLGASQAISEPLSQSQLNSKHSSGVAGASANRAVSGFDYINQLVQVPKHFKEGAAHATVDGLVQRIEDAPAGGKYVWIEGNKHYVGRGFDVKVKKGDKVEAGDVISDGIPNPAMVVKYKGIGEGRRYFTEIFRRALTDSGLKANRRNIELLARGAVNHIRLTEEIGDFVPDDIVPYSMLEAKWKPRPGYRRVPVKQAVGKYLERPYLHYSIGDRVRPSMLRDFQEFGVGEVEVHDDPPPFVPEMVRGMANIQHDPDWMVRMLGSGQKKSVLTAARRGGTSSEQGTSFVPALAKGVNFNRTPPLISKASPVAKFSQAAQETLARVKQAEQPKILAPQLRERYDQQQLVDSPTAPAVPAPIAPLTKKQLEMLIRMEAYARARQQAQQQENVRRLLIEGKHPEYGSLEGDGSEAALSTAEGFAPVLWAVQLAGDAARYGEKKLMDRRYREQAAEWLPPDMLPRIPAGASPGDYYLNYPGEAFDTYNKALEAGEPVPPEVIAEISQQLEQMQQQNPEVPMVTPEAAQAVAGIEQQVNRQSQQVQGRYNAAKQLSDFYMAESYRQHPDAETWGQLGKGVNLGNVGNPAVQLNNSSMSLIRDFQAGRIRSLEELDAAFRRLHQSVGTRVDHLRPDFARISQQTGVPAPIDPQQQSQRREIARRRFFDMVREVQKTTGLRSFSPEENRRWSQLAEDYVQGKIDQQAFEQRVRQFQPEMVSRMRQLAQSPSQPTSQVAQSSGVPATQQPQQTQPPVARTQPQPRPKPPTPIAVSPAPGITASNPQNFRSRLSGQWSSQQPFAGMASAMGGLLRQSPQLTRSLVRSTGPLGAGIFGLAVSPQDTMTLLRGSKKPSQPTVTPKPAPAAPGPKVQPVKSKTETPV